MSVKTTLKQAVLRRYPQAGDVKRRLTGDQGVRPLRVQVRGLTARVAELEEEVQEARRLNQRVAELTDLVAEVLLPVDESSDDRLREALTAYNKSL